MACYISSNDNRYYAAMESAYGTVPAITAVNRFPALKLGIKSSTIAPQRRDKTGTRSFLGLPPGLRKETNFEVRTYLTNWSGGGTEPGYGPLFRAAMGGIPRFFTGVDVASVSGDAMSFTGAHGLEAGQGIAIGGEIRFAKSIVSGTSIELNAPFAPTVMAGSAASPTVTYKLAKTLPSVSIFDYWSPATAVQRLVAGAAVNEMRMTVNGDFHEFTFTGQSRGLIDSISFQPDQGLLTDFPVEPAVESFDYSIVPGHLGQVWLGATPTRFYSLTAAAMAINNDLDFRAREFGFEGPRCIVPGPRTVNMGFDLFSSDTAATNELYQMAREGNPIEAMLQLGQTPGQLFGIRLKSVVPEVPEFEDSESRLQWRFGNCRGQGSGDDEMTIAFG